MRSTIHRSSIVVVVSVLAGGARSLAAQSLADVARQEEQRRKEITTPAKVYTNSDLGPVPSTPPASPSTTTSATPTAAPAADTAKEDGGKNSTQKDEKDTAKPVVKDRAYWAGRMKELTADLDRNQTYTDAVQTRINVLTADFSARDDPAQRAVIGRDRQKSLAELDRLKKAVQANRKAIADVQEDARRMGIPPGWLR